ncbi:MAG: class I tRNA ligase family protein [Hymenobacter sp.]
MSLATTYSPTDVEAKWYAALAGDKAFSKPSPTPKGCLHRRDPAAQRDRACCTWATCSTIPFRTCWCASARMQGKERLLGAGHRPRQHRHRSQSGGHAERAAASSKQDLTREEFLAYAWEWKEKYGGIILEQLQQTGRLLRLGPHALHDGARADTTRCCDVFVDLYNKGQIYRGVRMVNWDPQGRTAVSDEEVIAKDVQAKMYYLRYEIAVRSRAAEPITSPSLRRGPRRSWPTWPWQSIPTTSAIRTWHGHKVRYSTC